ncbi:MAG: sulfotransferase family protein [Actinomycetota bacterium]
MTVEYAFVLGTGRCGSTLVHEVIARHPGVGFVSNLEDRLPLPTGLGRWNNDLYRRVPDRLTRKGRLRFAPSEGYRVLDRQVSPALSTPFRDLVAEDVTPWLETRTRRFFEERARVQGRPVFLHKFTGWPRAGFLRRILPDARFVHVIRDGRAVANSFIQMPWWRGYRGPEEWGWGPLSDEDQRAWEGSGRSFALLAGLEWRILMEAFEVARAAVPGGQWLDIRYEDFIAEPRERTEQILDFLGLPWTPAFEEGFRRYRFDPARQEAYRSDLGIHDVALLDAALRPELERHAYGTRASAKGDSLSAIEEDL